MVALRPDRSELSDRKIQANRLNAQRSTGPRTDAGKARAARNAVTHGVYCRDLVLPGESQAEFDALREALVADLRPRTAAEALVVEQVLTAEWKLRRVRSAEREMYQAHARAEHQIEYENAAAAQEEWTDEVWRHSVTRKPVQGPPPPPPPPLFDPEKVTAGQSLAALVGTGAYDRLARLDERLNRQVHRSLRELRLLRKDEAEMDEEAAEVTEEAEVAAEPDARNEPTGDAADVQQSAANGMIMENEPTADTVGVVDPPVVMLPAGPEAPFAPPDGA